MYKKNMGKYINNMWKTFTTCQENNIYIYIYIERERERELAFDYLFTIYLACEYITLQRKNKKESVETVTLSKFILLVSFSYIKHNKPKGLV